MSTPATATAIARLLNLTAASYRVEHVNAQYLLKRNDGTRQRAKWVIISSASDTLSAQEAADTFRPYIKPNPRH
ncbi:hypothetical protein BIV57_11845 [Mangrovactinospora gilvigrisea]|uniref:Uncharacterized protein n=1 Tax=Mangrovactinospora gilvigrisea TaxID=1428644 RepID=A0A1J7BFB9_9ACTN|nr:hypothetical protein [Mangrovactinospora gilvigrisea]OIV37269.1 hypothetical protein BIV57_11845 [Mangrovactinospora gilvigrisea]